MPRRVVTARQLTRELSSVLDTLCEEKAPVTITRRGIPVAEIRPLQVIPWKLTETDIACGTTLPDVDIDALDLTADQRKLLTVCREHHIENDALAAFEGRTGTMALIYLEIKGLARKTSHAGFQLTDLGSEVAQILRAEVDSTPSA